MKQVIHQVLMQCTYITTEAMTTPHVQVFYAMYFQTAGGHSYPSTDPG